MSAEPARNHSLSDRGPSGVVQPLSRAAARRCSRPGCPTPATVTLAFQYGARQASLTPLTSEPEPQNYDLCGEHADRTRPPHRWTLQDNRPDDVAPPPPADDLASPQTVAVLAAALHGDGLVTGASTDPGAVDTAALDRIVEEPMEQGDVDLFAAVDEADPDGAPPPRTVPGARRSK